MSQKKWQRGGVRERGRKNIFSSSQTPPPPPCPPHEKRVPLKTPAWEVTYSLPLTLFQALPRLFSSVLHFAPLSTIHTVHYALNRLVHSAWARQFFPCRCKASIDVHLGAADILKAHNHAATIPALASVKPTFFLLSVVLTELFFVDGVSSSIETS